jgi:hypothetical protein
MQSWFIDTEDAYIPDGKTGGINVIDLANINSAPLLLRRMVKKIPTTLLKVLGRFDNSDIRGCNLMVH